MVMMIKSAAGGSARDSGPGEDHNTDTLRMNTVVGRAAAGAELGGKAAVIRRAGPSLRRGPAAA